MDILEDKWLSGIFGYGVFKINVVPSSISSPESLDGVRDGVREHAGGRQAAMYYSKVDTAQVDLVRALGAAGLYVVDVNVTLGVDARSAAGVSKRGDVVVCEAEPRHHERLLEIATTCFQYSRFHLDPLISNETANLVKREWIHSYVRKERGDKLFAALLDGQPVGFLAVLASESPSRRTRTIDLIGVAKTCQRRGVGQALVAYFIERYGDRCDWLQVGTQAANLPSIRLYEQMGFSVAQTQYVMHMHVPGREQGA